MFIMTRPGYANLSVPALIKGAGLSANSHPTTGTYAPREYASFRIVVKKFAQTLRCKIGFSHDALQMLIGQRPGAIRSRYSASLF